MEAEAPPQPEHGGRVALSEWGGQRDANEAGEIVSLGCRACRQSGDHDVHHLRTYNFDNATEKPAQPVGILWAVISAVFVFRDTREHSLSAGISRLFATCVSFALCLVYLLLFRANPLGMAILIAIGALLATAVPASCGYGRRRHGWYWLQMDRVVFVFSCQRTRGELAIGS